MLESPGMERTDTARLLTKVRGMALFREALEAPEARDFLVLLEMLSEERPDPGLLAETFGRLWEGLALDAGTLLPDAWQSYLVGRILDGENSFSLSAEKGDPGSLLLGQARLDLRTLQGLFDLDAEAVFGLIEDAVQGLTELWVPWTMPEPVEDTARHDIARELAASEDWGGCAELLAGYYARHGAGDFSRYRVFRWRKGRIHHVPSPDPVSLEDLVGYEDERELLLGNTRRLLAGQPSHHALLYGLPGTGKSSTVKAVSNGCAREGLRLVEVAKEDLTELPRVLDKLRDRGPRFIIFVDDLSFEEHEVEYKSLKALLEGSVEEPAGERADLRHLQPPQHNPGELLRPSGERIRRRSRPRHHAGKALARGAVRVTDYLAPAGPETVPGDRAGARPETRHRNLRNTAHRTAPCSGTSGTPAAPDAPPGSSWTSWRPEPRVATACRTQTPGRPGQVVERITETSN